MNCLNLIEDIVLHPIQLYEEMKDQTTWKNEKFWRTTSAAKDFVRR